MNIEYGLTEMMNARAISHPPVTTLDSCQVPWTLQRSSPNSTPCCLEALLTPQCGISEGSYPHGQRVPVMHTSVILKRFKQLQMSSPKKTCFSVRMVDFSPISVLLSLSKCKEFVPLEKLMDQWPEIECPHLNNSTIARHFKHRVAQWHNQVRRIERNSGCLILFCLGVIIQRVSVLSRLAAVKLYGVTFCSFTHAQRPVYNHCNGDDWLAGDWELLTEAREGLPAAILPLIHYALLGYSRHLARYLSANGYILYAKSDLRFVECVGKLLRKEFDYRCPLTVAQIFARGFAEKKFLFVHDVIQDHHYKELNQLLLNSVKVRVSIDVIEVLDKHQNPQRGEGPQKMCKKKHNDLLRLVRQNDKKRGRFQPKALARVLQRATAPRGKQYCSKFDRRCEMDFPPKLACKQICRTCKQNPGNRPPRPEACPLIPDAYPLSLISRTLEETCYIQSSALLNCFPTRTTVMTPDLPQKVCKPECNIPSAGLQENVHIHEATSPRTSPTGSPTVSMSINPRPSQLSNISLLPNIPEEECTSGHSSPTTPAPQEGCDMNRGSRKTSPVFHTNAHVTSTSPVLDYQNFVTNKEGVTSKEKSDCKFSSSNGQPQRAAQETQNTTNDCPEEMWQKIMDLADKIETCFSSLDNKLGVCFNSLDDKFETRFNYLNAGVTHTRETLQEKLTALETRVQQLETTFPSQASSPTLLQSTLQVKTKAPAEVNAIDPHAIRNVTNTWNRSVDNQQYLRRNFANLHTGDGPHYNLHQNQNAQQKFVFGEGMLKGNTQDFIAGVRARFNQTRELLKVNDSQMYGGSFHIHEDPFGTP